MKVTDFPDKKITDYLNVDKEGVERIVDISRDLKGLKVVHVNATSYGGGVAELLYTLVPLMRSVGINAEWEVMEAPNEFFNVTKKFHNLLQGAKLELTDEEWALYLDVSKKNSEVLDMDADVVVIHDPQPAALVKYIKEDVKKIWRCHIDLSTPNIDFWDKFREFLSSYDRLLFHMKEYFPEDFKDKSIEFPPSIDPLSDKNKELSKDFITGVLKSYGISTEKPLITVVARFDPWKDLFSAIDVYRLVKKESDIQLAIVSAMASDDPEGWIFYEKVLRYAGMDEDIKFLTNLVGVGSLEVNAIQRASWLGLHTATREGFGLVISEMMWKGNPVVARPAGGVKLQVDDGINGYLRWNVEEISSKVIELIKDDDKRKEFGRKAKEKVKEKFLSTSHLERYLKVIRDLVEG